VLGFEHFLCFFLQFSRNLGLFIPVNFVTQDTVPWHDSQIALNSITTKTPCNLFNWIFFGNSFQKHKVMLFDYQELDIIGKNSSVKKTSGLGSEKWFCYHRWWFKLGCRLEYLVKFFWRFDVFFPMISRVRKIRNIMSLLAMNTLLISDFSKNFLPPVFIRKILLGT